MKGLTVADVGELELVERILDKLGPLDEGVRVGPGDDAVVLAIGGSVVLTPAVAVGGGGGVFSR